MCATSFNWIEMHSYEIVNFLFLCLAYLRIAFEQHKRGFQGRRWWVKPHLREEIRSSHGAYVLFKYFQLNDHEEFFDFTRMSVYEFEELHELIKNDITKKDHIRKSLQSELRLAVVLQ